MPKTNILFVTAEQRVALEHSAKHATTYSVRRRCQAVLLKTDKRPSRVVGQDLGCSEMAVNIWCRRYQEQGLAGLQTKSGRGRKAILHPTTDLDAVRRAVQQSRQRISLAKDELERELGKEFSLLTLKRFLKKRLPLQTASTAGKAQAKPRCLCPQMRGPLRSGGSVGAGAHRPVLRGREPGLALPVRSLRLAVCR